MDTATLHSVLTDFGLARIISQTNSIGTRTMMAGSPGFQPPEQLRSESVGPECDVYAFGGVTTITLTEKVLCVCYQSPGFFRVYITNYTYLPVYAGFFRFPTKGFQQKPFVREISVLSRSFGSSRYINGALSIRI